MKSFFNRISSLFSTPKTNRIKKTTIGKASKASKGFDFLGKRILPIGVLPSTAALSRLQRNTERLYEQGASKKRIVQYWKRWLGWATVCGALLTMSHSVHGLQVGSAGCTATDFTAFESGGGDGVGFLEEETAAPASCTSGAGDLTSAYAATATLPLALVINTRNDGTPLHYTKGLTFLINSVISQVSLGGEAIVDGHTLDVTAADPLDLALCYTFGGVRLHRQLTKTATTHSVSLGAAAAGTDVLCGTEVDAGTAGTGGLMPPENPGAFGGELTTPNMYKLTVSKIEFRNTQGILVPLAEDGSSYDVAGVDSNTSVGAFGTSNDLPSGTYTEIRVTLSGDFEISVSGSDKGSNCRTDSGGSSGAVSGTLDNVGIGSNDGGTATPQSVSFPTGATADAVLNNAGITRSGNDFIFTAPVNFIIEEGSVIPSIAIDIDVKHAVEVLTANGNCNILPQPPSVNIKVGG